MRRWLRKMRWKWRMRPGATRFVVIEVGKDGEVGENWDGFRPFGFERRWLKLFRSRRSRIERYGPSHNRDGKPVAYVIEGEVQWFAPPTPQERLLVAAKLAEMQGVV